MKPKVVGLRYGEWVLCLVCKGRRKGRPIQARSVALKRKQCCALCGQDVREMADPEIVYFYKKNPYLLPQERDPREILPERPLLPSREEKATTAERQRLAAWNAGEPINGALRGYQMARGVLARDEEA